MNIEQIHSISVRRSVLGNRGALLAGVCLAPFIATALSNTASAADWRLIPSVSFGETYTDNVRLSNTNKRDDWVQSIQPRLQLTTEGRRITADITGGVDYLYFDRLNKDDLRPDVQGTATIDAVPDLLRIQANVSVTQRLINPAGVFSISQFNDTTNRQTLQLYSAGPTLYHRFGGFTDAQLTYQFSFTNANRINQVVGGPLTQTLSNRYLHNLLFQADSGDDFTRFTWSATANYLNSTARNRSTTPPTSRNRERFLSQVTGNYEINSTLAAIVQGGYDYIGGVATVGPGRPLRGGFWYEGGFQLNGPRTTFQFLAGRRFGGLAIDANLTYRISSRTSLSASVTQDITSSAARLISLLGLAAASDFATTFGLDPQFTLSDELYYSRRGQLQLNGSRGKNSFSIMGYVNRRSFRIVPRSDLIYGGRVTWSRQLNRKWTFDSLGLYTHQHFNNVTFRRDDIIAGQLGLTDNFARSFNASLTYRYSYRHSNVQIFNVQENAVTLLLTAIF